MTLRQSANNQRAATKYAAYCGRPGAFALEVLDFRMTPQQERMANSLLIAPYRVLVPSANEMGKTANSAAIVLWWFATRQPSVVRTTAPKFEQVKDLLWKEIRRLARRIPEATDWMMPKACRMERNADDYAVGTTSSTETGVQGHHGPNQLFVMDEACHDDQTDVMTEFGWRRFSDLDGSERLLTMDPETHVSELVKPDRIVKNRHVGELYEYQAKGANWCVTSGHNMYWRRSKYVDGKTRYGPWIKSNMEDVASRVSCHMTRTVKWEVPDRETFVIPAVRPSRKSFPELVVSMDDWAEFLGWYCSEGCLSKAKNGLVYGAIISQNAGPKLEEIEAVCTRLGFRPKRYLNSRGCYGVHINSLQIGRWLAALGPNCREKGIPDCIRNASARQIKIFLDAYLKGDGYRHQNTDIFYTSSPRMADGLQELVLKIGGTSHLNKRSLAGRASQLKTHVATSSTDGYVVTWCHAQGLKFNSKNLRKVPYDGYVWCAALPYHHLLLTRRNGHVLWSGNTGIPAEFFAAYESMFSPPGHAWLAIFNPTTTDSQVYVEYSFAESAVRKQREPAWTVVRMSALEHPNIAAELRGLAPPVPHAMRADKFARLLAQWSTIVPVNALLAPGSEGGPSATDVVWPPLEYCTNGLHPVYGAPQVFRPGPEAEARLLARFPSQGSSAVWGEADWLSACRELDGQLPLLEKEAPGLDLEVPEIGCDVARFGEDMTEIHTRVASVSLTHEAAGKRPTDETAGRLIEIARWLADWFNARKEHLQPPITEFEIPIKIDDCGIGGAVTDGLKGKNYNVVPVNAGELANDGDRYPNKRSELWFVTADRAKRGDLDLSRLDVETLDQLRRQALTATWKLDQDGRRVVQRKDEAKKVLKRSPDGIDSVNLAYYQCGVRGPSSSTTTTRRGR